VPRATMIGRRPERTMRPHRQDSEIGGTWSLVLAGGSGTRLRSLTTRDDVLVPKQYCALRQGPSLLMQTLIRAASVTHTARTCAVVAAQHRWCWESQLASMPRANVFVQPQDRGTAHGVLLALLQLRARDPHATVLMLPADHYVKNEAVFARSLRNMIEFASHTEEAIYLLGAEPGGPDTELGYIVPAHRHDEGPAQVLRFVEKPDAVQARRLLAAGALWNMFIIAGSADALLQLYALSHASSLTLMRAAISEIEMSDTAALASTYRELPAVDFSRDLLEPQASRLQVLRAPPCGWSDLGTPKRVIETLTQLHTELDRDPVPSPCAALSLADQYGRLSRGNGSSTLI
jgi:mannose-1-phosphate guanylyltransferase